MARTLTSVSIFLASPSDVDHERNVVSAAIEEWNARYSRDRSLVFDLMRWETSISAGFGTDGQAVINTQIEDEYDVLIGLFWAKLGTPTPRAESGTVEEYERALARFQAREKVEICFFFKDAPINFRSVDLLQVTAVKDFEQRVQSAGALTKSFRDDEGLKLEVGLLLDRVARSFPNFSLAEVGDEKAPAIRDLSKTRERPADVVKTGSETVDEDIGLFDAIENLDANASAASRFLDGMSACLQSLTSTTSAVASEYEEIKRMRPLSPAEAKPGIQRVCISMDAFSEYLEQETSAYAENVAAIANDIRDVIRISYDFIDTSEDMLDTLWPFRTQLSTMSVGVTESTKNISDMMDTVIKL